MTAQPPPADASRAPTKAIIVAAGRGRRLRPHTDEVPKCLVELAGRSLLAWQLRAYRACGVRDIVVVRGYRGEILEARARQLDPAIRTADNPHWAENNILESLFCAGAELEEPCLLSYGDIVFTPRVARAAAGASADIGIVIDRDFEAVYEGRSDHPLEEAELAEVSGDRVTAVGKRAVPPERARGEFIGLVKLSARGARTLGGAWRELKAGYEGAPDAPFQRAPSLRVAYLTDMLQYLIDCGFSIEPVEIRGGFREIDTVQDLQRAADAAAELEEEES